MTVTFIARTCSQQCRSLSKIAYKHPNPDAEKWSSKISQLVKQGQKVEALNCLRQMIKNGELPNEFTLSATLKSTSHIHHARQLHALIYKLGYTPNTVLSTTLMNLYSKYEKIVDARHVFDEMRNKDTVSWCGMIAGYCKYGYMVDGFMLFSDMRRRGTGVHGFALASLVGICSSKMAVYNGRCLHGIVIQCGFESDVYIGSSLVDMYAKCGRIGDARQVFDEMPDSDCIAWNALVAGYAHHGYNGEAVEIFCGMLGRGMSPNHFTFSSTLKACEDIGLGECIHGLVVKLGCGTDLCVGTALVDVYAKYKDVEHAFKLFERMDRPNVVCYNAMMAAYVRHEMPLRALELFVEMLAESVELDVLSFVSAISASAVLKNPVQSMQIHALALQRGINIRSHVGNALTDAYSKCSCMEYAVRVFEEMDEEAREFAWTSLISGYTQNGYSEEGLKAFEEMRFHGRKPDEFTFSIVLRACSILAAMETGKSLHSYVIKTGYDRDVFVGSSLVDMYSKCGTIDDAISVFGKLAEKSVISWNTMITAYAQHGLGKKALSLFYEMLEKGHKPTDVTFIGILYACSHLGLVDEGFDFFEMMKRDYGIKPRIEHYTCMVDLLGRAGRLNHAKDFIIKCPSEPGIAMWLSLLRACRVHGNVGIGEEAAERSISLEPNLSSIYLLLSSIYAASGRWDDVEKTRACMKTNRAKREPGRSWIEVRGKVHDFVAGDRSHPQNEKIYDQLEILSTEMKVEGYLPDTSFASSDVEQEQKEASILHHSERLAIAFGLISTPPETPIRILKNLRICGDCHTAAKLISKIVRRQIIIRDANRFHHFHNGECSCGGYW